MSEYDVAIVGYGPVGAVLGLLLKEQGVSTLIIDRDTEVQKFPRAAHFDDEIVRMLQAVGLGHLSDAWENPPRYQYFDAEWKPFLARLFPAGISELGYKYDFMFFQPDLERSLRARLAEGTGAPTVLLGHEVLGIRQDADGVDLEERDLATGEVTTHRAKWLVGADGASSIVRKSMATTFEQLAESYQWYVVDIRLTGDADPCADQWEFCDPERIVTYVPLSCPYRRFEFDVKPGESQADLGTPEKTWELLSPWLKPDEAEILRNDIYRFHSLLADRWRDGRVLIAGDAAHLMTPKLGQGLCTGIRDVANLSWKLGRVVRGQAGPELLDSYEAERKAPARQYIEISAHMVSMIVQKASGEDGEKEVVEQIVAGRQKLGDDSARAHDELIGTLSRQPVLADGSRMDDSLGWRFALLATAELADALTPADLSALVALGAVVLRADDPAIADYLADVQRGAILLRPDRYIAGTATTAGELGALLESAAATSAALSSV
ncbi:bifunctional 3-(3-hydroxy-phenyl)propionate/3-hydroxycinnamic acid hydroxylase [soil metagenome]